MVVAESKSFAPTFQLDVGQDDAGNWRVVVLAAPDMPPVVVARDRTPSQVAALVRYRIAEHFAIPESVVRIDMGRAWR